MNILIPVKIYQKLRAYVEATPYEISGLGKIKKQGQTITIEEIKIFRQYVTGVETTLDRGELAKFYDELIQKGEDLGDWKLWWHSHADMQVFFSSTDTATIEDFDNETQNDNWMLSIVTNKKSELLARIDIFYPIRYTIKNVDWDVSFKDRDIMLNTIDEVTENLVIGQNPTSLRKKKKGKLINFSGRRVRGLPLLPAYDTHSVSGEIIGADGLPIRY